MNIVPLKKKKIVSEFVPSRLNYFTFTERRLKIGICFGNQNTNKRKYKTIFTFNSRKKAEIRFRNY